MDTKNIEIEDFNYDLTDDRIAKFPLAKRDSSKLLIYNHGDIKDDVFFNLPDYLPEKAVMVFNNTKVILARLHFQKTTGAHIEVFLLEPLAPADYQVMFLSNHCCEWCCLVGNLKKWKEGVLQRSFVIGGHQVTLKAERFEEVRTGHRVRFSWDDEDVSFAEILDAVGELPIPPYLNRESQESDKTTYQTVYSKIKGSVAAPTAGLHFTKEVLDMIDKKGIRREEVTLHVGAGTFRPVKSQHIGDHEMHSEHFCVKRENIEQLLHGLGHVIAVGTTSVRTLESLYYIGKQLAEKQLDMGETPHVAQWEPYDGSEDLSPRQALENILLYMDELKIKELHADTQIIIAPGYDYKLVNMLVTNFHQPQSTLLLLVSAFVKGDWRSIYDYALQHDFRFLSYGDSSLIIP